MRKLIIIFSLFVLCNIAFGQIINTANIKNDASIYIVCPSDFKNDISGNVQNDGNIYVGGNFVNNSAFNSGNISNIKLDGAIQDIGGTSSTTFNNLIIDGTDNKTISVNSSVADSLVFNANKILLANNNLYLLPNATVVNANNQRFIVTNGTGSVIKKSLPLSTDFLFPVGDTLNSYKPVILNYTGVIDSFAVRVEPGVNPTTGADQTCVQNTWIIKESNSGGTTASLSLGWNTLDEGTSFVDSLALIWQNNSGTWASITGISGSITNVPATDWYHVTTGITNFSSTASRFILKTFPPPLITTQPTNQTACAGNNTTFSLTASGMGTLIYQWQENCGSGWSNLINNATYSGATSNNLFISNIPVLNNGCQYQCIVSNAGGSVTSTITSATVNPIFNNTATATICNGQSYTFGGTNYTTAGTYPHTFTSISGCDSLVTLTLNVNPVSVTLSAVEVCNGSSYVFNGNTYNVAGNYNDTLTTVNGCDSIIVTQLTVNPVSVTLSAVEVCNGSSYIFNGNTYTTAGNYNDTLTTVNGCDSIIITQLTVNPIYSANNPQTICNGELYVFNGNTYTTTGNYNDTLTSINGCDSIIITQLTVNPIYSANNPQTICNGELYVFNGNTYTTTGNYNDTLTTVNGCDSIITTQLTVNPVFVTLSAVEVCNGSSYIFNGNTYTTTGNYNDTLTTVNGCDSIVVTQLTVNPVFVTLSVVEVCNGNSYVFNGNTYTIAGNYNDTLTTVNGCDSIIVTQLSVNPVYLVNNPQTICSGSSYVFNGNTYTAAGNYNDILTTVNGCDSIVVTQLTVNPVYSVSISITSNDTTVCAGTNVIFTATTSNGGTSPLYQWYLNGNPVGSNNTTYSNSNLINNDAVYCVVTSSALCTTGNPATSGTVVITVTTNLPVSISIGASDTTICSGTNVTFTATAINGGTAPTYQWYLNGSLAGTNSAVYSSNNLSNNNVISCILTSGETCATGNPATSNTVNIQVTPTVTPSVNISSNPVTSALSVVEVCFGTSVTFHATPVNGGTNPTIQWFVNNNYIVSGANFSPTNISNNDQIYCVLTSTLACTSSSSAQSNTLSVMFNPLPVLSAMQQAESCHGAGDASINLNITQGTPPYSVHWGNSSVNATVTAANLHSGTYNVTVTDNKSCSVDTSIFISPEGSGCLFIPNVFSPNGDSKNDMLYVRGGNIKSLSLVIYDRWGNKIFETDNQNNGWDGTYNGTPLNAGVFVYYLKAELQNGNITEQQGNITLLK